MPPVNGLYGRILKNDLKSALLLASFAVLGALFFLFWCVIYVSIADYLSLRFASGHKHAQRQVVTLLWEGAQRGSAPRAQWSP